jgi:hypothetical protein
VAKDKNPGAMDRKHLKIRFRPMVPDFLHEAPPTDAGAAFIKESRMKFVNARKLDRKSGCTLRRTWATRPGKGASFFDPTSSPPTYCTRRLSVFLWRFEGRKQRGIA